MWIIFEVSRPKFHVDLLKALGALLMGNDNASRAMPPRILICSLLTNNHSFLAELNNRTKN
jgi:hypothetical protein